MFKAIFYIVAVLCVFAWVFGFAVYSLGGVIHLLLLFAIVSLLLTGLKQEAK